MSELYSKGEYPPLAIEPIEIDIKCKLKQRPNNEAKKTYFPLGNLAPSSIEMRPVSIVPFVVACRGLAELSHVLPQ